MVADPGPAELFAESTGAVWFTDLLAAAMGKHLGVFLGMVGYQAEDTLGRYRSKA